MAKKVIIIGSGLGGLSCGVILAKNGYDVTVLEQGLVAGGCLQCFSRGGVRFETGMHFVGSAAPGQAVDRIFGFLGVKPYLTLSPLDTSGYEVINLAGDTYRFANGREAFIDTLCQSFPGSRTDLEKYMDVVDEISATSAMQSLNFGSADGIFNMEYQTRSVGEVISSVVRDEKLANVLAGNIPLYAGIKDRTPFATHAFINAFYNRSAFRFVGGSDSLASGMVKVIEGFGGRVLTNHRVSSIVCDDSKAIGVLAGPSASTDKEFFGADIIVSDAHPARTLELLDTKLIRPAYRSRINAMAQTVGAFTLYLKFRPGEVPYMNHNEYIYKGNTPWGCEEYTPESWPGGLIYMHMCHEPNPAFARSGVLISYMKMDDVRRWDGLPVGRRGEEYEAFKAAKASKVLALLEANHPGICSKIEAWWSSTPLSYKSYTGTEEGSMYGIERSIYAGAGERITHRTRIPNLLLTGQNINSHGIMGVFVGAFITCGELLGRNAIFEQIEKEGF